MWPQGYWATGYWASGYWAVRAAAFVGLVLVSVGRRLGGLRARSGRGELHVD